MVRPVRRWGSLDETQTRANLIEDARLYLGTSYRWGGKTPYGVDCSGFTAMAYMLNGPFTGWSSPSITSVACTTSI